MSEAIRTLDFENYVRPFRERVAAREFNPADPTNIPADAVTIDLTQPVPHAVTVPGGVVQPPRQARHIKRAADIEREMDRRRALEVIALAAIDYVDHATAHEWLHMLDILREAVDENRAVIAS